MPITCVQWVHILTNSSRKSLHNLLRLNINIFYLSQAIIKFVVSEGYPLERYEIVTNFPRRILTDLDETKTLKELNLFPQETVFVQQRS